MSTLPKPLLDAFHANTPAFWRSLPGVGKTASLETFFRTNNVFSVTLIASLRDPTDFGGLPILTSDERGYKLAAPGYVYAIKEAAAKGMRTALFIDELPTAPMAVQATALRVVQEGVVGDEALPTDCWRLAAGNPVEVSPNGSELSAPLANRFMHYESEPDANDFINNFGSYWGVEPRPFKHFKADEEKIMDVWRTSRTFVIDFLHSGKQNLVHNFPKDESKRSGAWPSPRSWDNASRILAVNNNKIEDALSGMTGLIGIEVAREFVAFAKNRDLPDPIKILNDPDSWDIAKCRGDITFSVLTGLYSTFAAYNEKRKEGAEQAAKAKLWYGNFFKVLGKAYDAGIGDIAAIFAGKAISHGRGLYTPPPEIRKFQELLVGTGFANVSIK